MYDKYSKLNGITIGSKIPTHKGVLLTNTSGTPAGVTMHFYKTTGGTHSGLVYVAGGFEILPIEVHTIPQNFPTGVTGFYLT